MVWISAVVVATTVWVGLGVRRWLERRQPAPARVVEQPNSFYSAPGVRQQVDQERWGRIRLDELHPVNRDEVARLIRLAETDGADTLSPSERRFMDNLADQGR